MKKAVLITLGFILLILGSIGIVVPVLPTTPLVILAAVCFSSSSTKIYKWLLNTKYFGAYIKNYRDKTGVDKSIKIRSLVFLWVMLAISAAIFRKWQVWTVLGVVGLAVSLHILMIRTKKSRHSLVPADKADIQNYINSHYVLDVTDESTERAILCAPLSIMTDVDCHETEPTKSAIVNDTQMATEALKNRLSGDNISEPMVAREVGFRVSGAIVDGAMPNSMSVSGYRAAALSMERDNITPEPTDDKLSATSIEEIISNTPKTFSEALLELIDGSGQNDVAIYKRALVDRKLFSKIRSDKDYRPSKATAISFAIALRLSLDDSKMLLMTAGFALSPSNKFDIIVQYYIERKIYDIFTINETLLDYDQILLSV